MSQSDYIRAKRGIQKTTGSEMQTMPSILDAGSYVEYKGRAIACSVRGTTLRVSQIIPTGRYEEFGIERDAGVYDTTACPAFVLCTNTDTRANRVAATMPMFSASKYFSDKYVSSVTSQCANACCYDAGVSGSRGSTGNTGNMKDGKHVRDAGACANARLINVQCSDAANLC